MLVDLHILKEQAVAFTIKSIYFVEFDLIKDSYLVFKIGG